MRPVIIAHRGASGHLPEHTLQAKALGFAMGADYLEQDVVATRDDRLVVLHDIHLDRVSDVAARFPDRARDDGRYYVRDFDLAEIRTLNVHERTAADGSLAFPTRRNYAGAEFRVHTLERELELVETLRDSTGREVGIYPEIKSPAWHRDEGVDISVLVLETLEHYGYATHSDPVYLQCFDEREVRRVRDELGATLKLVQLIGDDNWDPAPTRFAEMQTAAGLQRLAETVDGIGPWINQLYRFDNATPVASGLVGRAHAVGLVVHPYTFRDDALPPGFDSIAKLLDFAINSLAVDGLFTDFPDTVAAYIRNNIRNN